MLSIARKLGSEVQGFTTANFNLHPLPQDHHSTVDSDKPEHYYRTLKSIIYRPTSLSGQRYQIQGDHCKTIPTLYECISEKPIRTKQAAGWVTDEQTDDL